MSVLVAQLKIEAVNAFKDGKWLLAARICQLLAEIEIEAQIADVNGDNAWNARTDALPTIAKRERETTCRQCNTRAYINMIDASNMARSIDVAPTLIPGKARHANPDIDLDHPVRLKP